MVSNFDEALAEFDRAIGLLDTASRGCQKYGNLLLFLTSKQNEGYAQEIVDNVKQVRLLLRKISCSRHQIRDETNEVAQSNERSVHNGEARKEKRTNTKLVKVENNNNPIEERLTKKAEESDDEIVIDPSLLTHKWRTSLNHFSSIQKVHLKLYDIKKAVQEYSSSGNDPVYNQIKNDLNWCKDLLKNIQEKDCSSPIHLQWKKQHLDYIHELSKFLDIKAMDRKELANENDVNANETVKKFEDSIKLLDKCTEDCQKYANLLFVASKENEGNVSSRDMISDIRQLQLLVKKIKTNNEKAEPNKREAGTKRNTRSSSMKYLLQWEKVVEAHLAETSPPNEERPPLLPKPVIKRRVRQFENKDTKRASSTALHFLDEGDERPQSCAAIEEEEEDDASKHVEEDRFKPRVVDVVVSR